jgi:hypothetical protein
MEDQDGDRSAQTGLSKESFLISKKEVASGYAWIALRLRDKACESVLKNRGGKK